MKDEALATTLNPEVRAALAASDESLRALAADLERIGFVGIGAPALAPALHAELLEEALAQRAAAWENLATADFDQQLMRAELGPLGAAFLKTIGAPFLSALMGEALEVSRESTCYTYYDAAESRLGVHLDRKDSCACTLILYLEASHPPGAAPSRGLSLEVFAPGRAPGEAPVHVIPTQSNGLAIGRGSEVPHGRPNLAAGERVIALTACFHRAEAGAGARAKAAEEALLSEGLEAWGQGDLATAHARFQALAARAPMTAALAGGFGRVFWSAGDFEGARQSFKAAADLEGDDPSHWSNIGLALRDMQARDQAFASFRAALTLNPQFAPALNEWANTLQDQGEPAAALKLYERSLAEDASRAVVHHNLGVCWGRLGHDQIAAECYLTALRLDPGYAHALEELGDLYGRYGDLAQAQGYLARAGTPRAVEIRTRHAQKTQRL
ncbi:tetratricopeptide repeat protein [Neomegalonema sp.]|uniref:tetratricopeptide repeat protein n=1 Tax=Neomegalonema sp. TaxID=2039713 RepID=UPI0026210B72|nr:tetratricopeptide repeat protein [Neomegalonema sp.]MDD2867457.1 tetratricopeptide repeat protein [Neomegalonema sp.]